MKFGDFLNNLASKIGEQNNPALVSILSSSELANREISEELASKFDSGLMSLEGAKNNREVLNHYKPIILKAADDKFAILATKYGIENEIGGEKSTYAKIDLLEAKLAAMIADANARASQAGGNKDQEVTKLNAQLTDLQKQLQTLTASKDKEIADLKDASAKQQLDMLVNFELNGKKYANRDLGDTNVTIARALLDKELAQQKIVLVNENGVIRMKQADNVNLDVLDAGNKPLVFGEFTNKILADKKMLEVSSPTAPQQKPAVVPGTSLEATKFADSVQASLADLN